MFGQNLKYLRTQKGLSQMKLAEIMQIKRTSLSGYELENIEPNMANLIKFAKFFDVSVDDLIRHDVKQIKENKANNLPAQSGLQVLAVTVDDQNNELIDFVPVSAKAGYSSAYDNPDYVRELYHFRLPKMPQGTYRAFELNGDSMLPLASGSVVVGKYVEKIADIKDGQTAIVVTANDGVVYKRLYRNDDFSTLTLKSDNTLYEPYRVDYKEILEVWVFYAAISFEDAPTTINEAQDNILLYKIANDVSQIKSMLGN